MGTVIYSTSALGTFMGTFLTVGFILLIGVSGLGWAVFSRKQGRGARIGMSIAGLFLCGIGVLTLGITLLNMLTSTQTATVLLQRKTVAVDNCGDNGQTCRRYILETVASPRSYDFTVPQAAFDRAQQGGCYQVTYYPNKGLFATDYGTDLYVATSYVTRIVQADAGSCK